MMALITEGRIMPSAEEVAARANVGLRSVFRHFNDMETLYRAMAAHLVQGIEAIVSQPYTTSDWRGQIFEMIDRRAMVFERLTPFRRSERAHRHLSPFLQADHANFVARQRQALLQRLPPQALADPDLVDAADVLFSFETWLRLRDDQGLSITRAKRVLTLTMMALLSQRGLQLRPPGR
jgi:AcrR family transcriptional regulator